MARLPTALLLSAVFALFLLAGELFENSFAVVTVSAHKYTSNAFLRKFVFNLQRDSRTPAPPSTYTNYKSACQDCMRSFPNEKRCYYGGCDLRDPNTQPEGGVIGVGAEWKPPQNRVCFSLDPVSWFKDCGNDLLTEAKKAEDVAFACSYNFKIRIFPKQFHGDFDGYTAQRMDVTKDKSENCANIMATEGAKFYNADSAFDSNHKKLSGCCHTFHSFFTCLGSKKEELRSDVAGLKMLDAETEDVVKSFGKFCVPLYQYPTKPEFCKAYPEADPCVKLDGCVACTNAKGSWCPGSRQCLNGKDWDGTGHCYADRKYCDMKPMEKIKPKLRVKDKPKKEAPKIEVKPVWYWKVVHGDTTKIVDIIPDNTKDLKQGEPKLFDCKSARGC